MHGLFFTGTDTGVGKTVVTAAVARSLRKRGCRVGVCKPVATGARLRDGKLISDDTLLLARAAGVEDQLKRVTPWVFAEPVAPPVAANKNGVVLTLPVLAAAVRWWEDRADAVLVEGVGGLLCPLTERETVADLATALGFPLVVVARNTLGTLNHTLLTLEVAQRRGLTVAGVILNEVEAACGLAERTNLQELRGRIAVPVLTVVRHRTRPDADMFEEIDELDWRQLMAGARGGWV